LAPRYKIVAEQIQILAPGTSPGLRKPGPVSNKALRSITNQRNEIVATFAATGEQPLRGSLTRAGVSFQKHSARGEFSRTSNSQTTFNQQGANLLRSITTHGHITISVTPRSNHVRITAPSIGSANFTREGVFVFFSQQGQ